MKLRDSGMPEESHWETLFDVELILERLGINSAMHDVVELGCGYGTFTIPVAKRISGTIRTFDIDPAMVARTSERAAAAELRNVVCEVRDTVASGYGLSDATADACLLFNILHGEDPVGLLRQAAKVVRPGGWVLVIHWRCDLATPRGPALNIRPRPEQVGAWAHETGRLRQEGEVIDLLPWHFGLRFRRV
jgi:SAM-dependent methyltransferase